MCKIRNYCFFDVRKVRFIAFHSSFCFFLSIVLVAILPFRSAWADWINLSGAENAPNIAEIYVEDDHVLIKLEVFVEDMVVFEELIPDDFFSRPIPNRPKREDRQQIFGDAVLPVVTDNGKKLPVTFKLVELRNRVERPSPFVGAINPYTRQPVPGPPDDKRVLCAELIYPFQGKPESLTFIPPLDEKGFPKASIGFICYHNGVPVVDFRYLTDSNILRLDWDDSWYSEFDKRALKRTFQSGVRTYLYIEPHEVRQEILVRVKDMMAWMDFELQGEEFIEENEFNLFWGLIPRRLRRSD